MSNVIILLDVILSQVEKNITSLKNIITKDVLILQKCNIIR